MPNSAKNTSLKDETEICARYGSILVIAREQERLRTFQNC